jgi:excisionase family DNA binding protein
MSNIILQQISVNDLQLIITDAIKEQLQGLKTVPPPQIEYITRNETIQILGCSLVTLNVWTKEGKLSSYRIGTRIRYKKDEVLNSLKKRDFTGR